MTTNNPTNFLDPLGLAPSSKCQRCCCVEDVDIVVDGPFHGGLSLNDYFPKLVGKEELSDEPNMAGTFVTPKFVGGKIQMISRVKGPGSECYMSQDVWVEVEMINGRATGRANQNFDDIIKSNHDPTKPPFRQYANGGPSLADPPNMPNKRNTLSTRWFTTCVGSGGSGAATKCKSKKCCARWRLEINIPANLDIRLPVGSDRKIKLTREGKWCQ